MVSSLSTSVLATLYLRSQWLGWHVTYQADACNGSAQDLRSPQEQLGGVVNGESDCWLMDGRCEKVVEVLIGERRGRGLDLHRCPAKIR